MNKPLIITLEESKKELVSFINELGKKNNLSYYLLDIIVSEVYRQIINGKTEEIQKEFTQYYKKEEEENVENKE